METVDERSHASAAHDSPMKRSSLPSRLGALARPLVRDARTEPLTHSAFFAGASLTYSVPPALAVGGTSRSLAAMSQSLR